MKISLAIPHTPWVAARVESMKRLRAALVHDHSMLVGDAYEGWHEFTERESNWIWSQKMWAWSAETEAEWCLFLQDDVIVAPNFWPALHAMLEALDERAEVVGLQVAHPVAPALADEGHRFFTTTDALVGVGYAVRSETLRAFLAWRNLKLKEGAVEAITEDTLLGLFCACTGRRVWHPLPTIIDHDVSIESSYGNDAHKHRRSMVRWDNWCNENNPPILLESGHNWKLRKDFDKWLVPHLGRFYEATPMLAAAWVKDWDSTRMDALVRDNGYSVMRTLSRRRALRLPEPQHRVMVATRTRAFCHEDHKASVAKLVAMPDVYVDARFSVDRVQARSSDVVRASSILAHDFLTQTDATHLLFLDSDVSCEPEMVRGMLATEKDLIAAPYPAREGIDWKAASKSPPELAEAFAYHYRLHLLDAPNLSLEKDATAEVKHMPLGAMLVSRECLQKMTEHYGDEFFHESKANPRAIVALFMLLFEDHDLWSEDFSFCERWRRMGGKVWMYLGAGSPANHHGDHTFRGAIEAFGLRRLES